MTEQAEKKTRKFKNIDFYSVSENKNQYFLLPFRFHRINEEKEIIVNEVGDYLIIPKGTYEKIVRRQIDKEQDADLYADLLANFFISEEQITPLIDILATRYRTKKLFLNYFTGLHIFVITLRCEHTCSYCQVSRVTQNKDKYDMSIGHIDRGIDMMFRSPNPHVTMEFQGGEALLAFDKIQYAVNRAEKIAKEKNKMLTVVICTNLALIDDNILEYCKEHNILISTSLDGPKFIHVKTVKGKGYKFAQDHPEDYHGVGKFDYRVGVSPSKTRSISSIVGITLAEMANYNENIVAITAAMPTGTGLNIFSKLHPDRYFDVGIAEQHATTFAAGLAKAGIKPYFAVYSSFLQRGYDQLIHDVCITSKPVTFLIDRAGLVGNDGETHHGMFDLSYLNPIPNLTVMAPMDSQEMIDMIRFSERIDSPLAIRYPRGNEYVLSRKDYDFCVIDREPMDSYSIGQPQVLIDEVRPSREANNTKKMAIISIGNMMKPVLDILPELRKEYRESHRGQDFELILLNARYLKPLNEDTYLDILGRVDNVITLEDNVVTGGFGANIMRLISENKLDTSLDILGIPDKFIEQGNTEILMDELGLSPGKIKDRILKIIE